MSSLYDDLPKTAGSEETFNDLLTLPGIRIERIVSRGHISPPKPDEFYDQSHEEFVLVVQGGARLEFPGSGEAVEMKAGDWLHIPAHQRHRVSWTQPDEQTIWLAVHFGGESAASAAS